MPKPINPYVLLEWEKPTPAQGVDFVRYNLGVGPAADGYRIATVEDIDTTEYAYHEAPPGEATYWASWTGSLSGALIESERVSTTATLAFERGWLHDTGDPSINLRILASRLQVGRQQEINYARRGGESAPTPLVRRSRSRRWQLALLPNRVEDGSNWDAISRLQDQQYDHVAILCLRQGSRPGERSFVTIQDPDATREDSWERITLTAQEVSYRETV